MLSQILIASVLLISPILGQNSDIEVAPYEVVETKATYEVRDYPARKWVSTDNVATDIHGGIEHSVSFDRLFQYISGNNVNNTKIDMTSPVTFFIKRNEDPEAEKEFTMSFYIPAVHQDEPIQPQAENVFIENRASFRVVATQFGGFASSADYEAAAQELYETATADGFDLITETYYNAGYDSPYTIFNRRNEAWFVVREA